MPGSARPRPTNRHRPQGPTTTGRSRTRTRRDRRRKTNVARSHEAAPQRAEWRQVKSRKRKGVRADANQTPNNPERATALVATNPPAARSHASEQPAPKERPQTAPIQPNTAPAPSHPTSANTCTSKEPRGRDGATQASQARMCNLMHRATENCATVRAPVQRTVAYTETQTVKCVRFHSGNCHFPPIHEHRAPPPVRTPSRSSTT